MRIEAQHQIYTKCNYRSLRYEVSDRFQLGTCLEDKTTLSSRRHLKISVNAIDNTPNSIHSDKRYGMIRTRCMTMDSLIRQFTDAIGFDLEAPILPFLGIASFCPYLTECL
jgi:hypothetical protein